MKNYKAVLEDIISQEGNCNDIHCCNCPLNGVFERESCLPSRLALVEAKRMLLEEYTIPDILEKE